MENIAIKRALRLMHREWKHDRSRASFHYAFALKKSKVIAFGKNNITDASKKALKIGRSLNINKWKEYPYIHAECDVISQLSDYGQKQDLTIISLRINRDGQFRMAKPCYYCQKALDILGYDDVWWSVTSDNQDGKLILSNNIESIDFDYAKF